MKLRPQSFKQAHALVQALEWAEGGGAAADGGGAIDGGFDEGPAGQTATVSPAFRRGQCETVRQQIAHLVQDQRLAPPDFSTSVKPQTKASASVTPKGLPVGLPVGLSGAKAEALPGPGAGGSGG